MPEKPSPKRAPRAAKSQKPAQSSKRSATASAKPTRSAVPAAKPRNAVPAKAKRPASANSKPTPKRPAPASSPTAASTSPASALIDQRIRELGDWRGQTLARLRALIREALPGVVEEWKWETPVWSSDGIVCTGEAYAKVVKLTFARGAGVPDPSRLFNASLEGNVRRAIDIREGGSVDAAAFKALVRAAAELNASRATAKARGRPKAGAAAGRPREAAAKAKKAVRLLSGGNPQIPKGEGNAPVQAYVDALSGWKRDVVQRVDALVVRSVPGVRKAVKWNSPFYGVEGRGWFLSVHVFTRYVKLTFFNGAVLRPVPPGGTPRSRDARWVDVHEKEGLDEAQMADWVKQAAALPGWTP